MIKLDENYKINLASELTKLALENNLIREHSCPQDTANEICTFFKTLVTNLDSDEK